MRILPTLGAALVVAGLAGGAVLHPELLTGTTARPAASPVAVTSTSTGGAARQTVVSGMDPVTGVNGASLAVDRSLLGLPTTPNLPSIDLPELVLSPPAAGRSGAVTTQQRSVQVGSTVQWQAQPEVDGPVRQLRQRTTAGYVVVPPEPGELHLLCGPNSGTYYVDSHLGEWRVHRADGGDTYDLSYQFVQYDRSPISAQTRCR